MNEVELLTLQTKNAYEWTNKLIESVPFNKWDVTPEVVETNVTWQVGHLIMSHYFHCVMVIVGHRKDVLEKIPLRQYDDIFTNGQPADAKGKVNPELILGQLKFLQKTSLEILMSMTDERLHTALEPTHIPHPVAKTKFESLDWNIKHTMYHCGQIGMLKRIIDVRYDFGLRRGVK
ncbi:MAG TPA: DinB family protein [Chryseolinea sp.]